MTMINTNIGALRAQNGARTAEAGLSRAMERLSSGLRINSAKDDAAGLAISQRMTANIRGSGVAIRNANDGISMAQTAEGGLSEITNMLQRMRELTVQSANGTNSDSDRVSLQAEMNQLLAEVNNVAKTTTFNGIKLLDGSAKDVKLQTGVNSGETVAISIASTSTKSLGLEGYRVEGQLTTGRVGTLTGLASNDVLINGKAAFSAANVIGGNTAKDLALSVNSNTPLHGVKATAYNTLSGSVTSNSVFAAGDVTINGSSIGAAGSVEELVANINRDAAGVSATLNSNGTIALSNNTGDSIAITGTDPSKAGFVAGNYAGFVALESLNGSDISVQAANAANGVVGGAGTLADVKAFGLNETGNGSSFSSSAVDASALTATDDLAINGVKIGSSSDASALSKAAAINAASATSGVGATARTEAKVSLNLTATPGATDIKINGSVIDLSAATSLNDVVTTINASGVNGVRAAADSDGNLILSSAQGADVVLSDTGAFLTAAVSTSGEAGSGSLATGLTLRGRVTLEAANNGEIRVEGSTASLAKAGLAAQGGNDDLVGGNLNITSQANAAVALKAIDRALDRVSADRGDLGAVQNRLETTVNNLTSVGTNLTAARSRIQDADFAVETTMLAKSQILSQAATAMLAQANQSQQNVLSLLR